MNLETGRSEKEGNARDGRTTETDRQRPDFEARSFELSSWNTSLSFQQTRMGADRTLMSVISTSLALIGFGFTIFQFFRSLREAVDGESSVSAAGARNFGAALVWLGVGMLVMGILYHLSFMRALRAERRRLIEVGLVHGQLSYPVSMTLITALLLLLIGTIAIFGMATRLGPFD